MTEKTAAEIAAEELEERKLRGDFVDEENDIDDDGGSDASGDAESASGDESAADSSDAESETDDEEDSGDAGGEEDGSDVDGGDDGGNRGVSAKGEEDQDESIQIPKARFDEANRKARQKLEDLQHKLDAANAKLETQVESKDIEALRTEITQLEDKYEDHLVEGEVKEARAIRKELRDKQEALTEARLQQQSQQTGASTIQQIRFDTQLAAYEVKYPTLNTESEEFSQDVADEVTDLIAAFQARGLTPVASLNKAVHYVMRGTEVSESSKPDPEAERQKRAAKARRKVDKAKKQSPPDTKGAGRDSDKSGLRDGLPDVSKMSIEAFEKLSEKELRALREDSFAG